MHWCLFSTSVSHAISNVDGDVLCGSALCVPSAPTGTVVADVKAARTRAVAITANFMIVPVLYKPTLALYPS